jgi:hypothetical protein
LALVTVSAEDAGARERISDIVALEWLDDSHDEFHGCAPVFSRKAGMADQSGRSSTLPAAPAYRGPCQANSFDVSARFGEIIVVNADRCDRATNIKIIMLLPNKISF